MRRASRSAAVLAALLWTACGPPPLGSPDESSPRPSGPSGRSGSGLCAPCSSAADCGGPGDLCLLAPWGDRICAADCTSASCPRGYSCEDLGLGVRQCLPQGGSCADTGGPDDITPVDGGPPPRYDAGSPQGPTQSGECGMSTEEARVLELTNAERAGQGLAPYACDATLVQVARAHSKAMCDLGFFSHFDPSGDGPGDRVRAAGLSPRGVSENIAAGQRTPESAISSWMSSSGHRAAILSSSSDHIGPGYAPCSGGRFGHYWTQVFTRGL